MSDKQTIITRPPTIPYDQWASNWSAIFDKKDESKALTKAKTKVKCPKR